jgi:hypothetical protein
MHFLFICHFIHFGVVVRGKYEVVVHNIQASLDVHLDWVVLQVDVENTFNSILWKAIFQGTSCERKLIIAILPFVHSF